MRQKNTDYLQFDLNGKQLYFVLDHSTVLLTWKKAFEEKIINKGATIFHIDKHTDIYFNNENEEKSKRILEMSDIEIKDFIRNELSASNDEFIVNAMFSGLIKDGISIYFESFTRPDNGIIEDDIVKIDCNGIEHKYYLYRKKDIFNIDSIDIQTILKNLEKSDDTILDIDLDFFTDCKDGTIIPRNSDEINKQINSDFFNEIFNMSKVISIALEPGHCGGNEECKNILSSVMNSICSNSETLNLQHVKDKFLSEVSSWKDIDCR